MNEVCQFTKNDCGNIMTQDDSRKVMLDMLNALTGFCDEHGLRYFLSGGTLLGAIRHKGFIPWDDDVDVNMPRPDCEKLWKLTKGKIGRYRLMKPDLSGFSIDCNSYRLYDFNTVVESYRGGITTKYPVYRPMGIDIFPIEGLPDGDLATRLHYFKIVVCKRMQRLSGMEHMIGSNALAHIFHVVAWIPAKLVGYRRWSRMIQKTAEKYNFDTRDYVGVMVAPAHTVEEKVLKKDYMNSTDVLFEGKYYHAPGNYDVYLTQLYGDYMKMPPLDKQKSNHVFNLYWRKQKFEGE